MKSSKFLALLALLLASACGSGMMTDEDFKPKGFIPGPYCDPECMRCPMPREGVRFCNWVDGPAAADARIELKNYSPNTVNLNTWKIFKNGVHFYDIPTPTEIPAGGRITISPALLMSSPETLSLREVSGSVVDEIVK